MSRRVSSRSHVAACACLVMALAACKRVHEQRDIGSGQETSPTPSEWRAALSGGPVPDDLRRRCNADAIDRTCLIEILDGLLDDPEPLVRANALALLESRRPYELAGRLAGKLRDAREPQWAAALLSALREATRVEADPASGRVDERKLAEAFEIAQEVFRWELRAPGNHPLRFEEAVESIGDVFSAAEGDRLFAEIDQRLRPEGEPAIQESKLHGLWLEFKVGAAGGTGYEAIVEFIRSHPCSLDQEGTKERLVDMLRIAPVPLPERRHAYDELISIIEPAEAPDDSYVRWLEVQTNASAGSNGDWIRVLPTIPPMRQAALIHFSGIDFGPLLDPPVRISLRDNLRQAAEVQSDAERRAFLHDAAECLSDRPSER